MSVPVGCGFGLHASSGRCRSNPQLVVLRTFVYFAPEVGPCGLGVEWSEPSALRFFPWSRALRACWTRPAGDTFGVSCERSFFDACLLMNVSSFQSYSLWFNREWLSHSSKLCWGAPLHGSRLVEARHGRDASKLKWICGSSCRE